jgi:hypothetical protein
MGGVSGPAQSEFDRLNPTMHVPPVFGNLAAQQSAGYNSFQLLLGNSRGPVPSGNRMRRTSHTDAKLASVPSNAVIQ